MKTTLTDADAVTWELTRDGATVPMLEGSSKDGGMLYFMKDGTYILKGSATTEGSTASCDRTVEVLPIGNVAFSLPEYGYTDTTEEVTLLREKGLDGAVAWTLEKDGEPHPVPENFIEDGGALAMPETGTYILTATLKDVAGKKYTASQTITILPVLVPTVTASTEKVHEDETVAISLTVEYGTPSTVEWAMTHDGEGVSVSLDDNGGTLAFEGTGSYVLTVTVADELGETFIAGLTMPDYSTVYNGNRQPYPYTSLLTNMEMEGVRSVSDMLPIKQTGE